MDATTIDPNAGEDMPQAASGDPERPQEVTAARRASPVDDSDIPPASHSNEARKKRSRLNITHPVEFDGSLKIPPFR